MKITTMLMMVTAIATSTVTKIIIILKVGEINFPHCKSHTENSSFLEFDVMSFAKRSQHFEGSWHLHL
jgi:hypothetical protein